MRNLAFGILLLLIPIYSLGGPRVVTLWNYHDFPPFAREGAKPDLSKNLAQWLTQKSGGRFEFQVNTIPRKRLDLLLEEGKSGVVLWVNPEWFRVTDGDPFLWTSALVQDANAVVSHRNSAFEYKGPRSLHGKSVVLVSGYDLPALTEMAQKGDITLVRVSRELSAMSMLLSDRPVDVAIVSGLGAQHIGAQLESADKLHVSEQSHNQFGRHLMITPDLPEVADFLQQAVSQLRGGDEWCAIQRTSLVINACEEEQ